MIIGSSLCIVDKAVEVWACGGVDARHGAVATPAALIASNGIRAAESSREGKDEIPVPGEVWRGFDHPLWIMPYLGYTVRLTAIQTRGSRSSSPALISAHFDFTLVLRGEEVVM